MSKNLVIVESPAKGKTIEKYLGKDFQVLASYGHVRDLPSKSGSVNPEADFAMNYQVSEGAEKTLRTLQKAAAEADTIYLATDPDREGEAISWHVQEELKARLKGQWASKQVHRVTFTEITKTAVQQAVAHPKTLNISLIDAQQARRALDYLVGFTLSPVLWRKVRKGLSAGRVQSVALRLLCEREGEIEAFKPEEYWTIEADFATSGPFKTAEPSVFRAKLAVFDGTKVEKFSFRNDVSAQAVAHALQGLHWTIQDVQQKEVRRNPAPPFITSTLQQEAARKLGFSAKKTMNMAQRLYEAGHITYMRTDAVNLAREAVAALRQTIEQNYGAAFLPSTPNLYKSKNANAQEAHEAIRPTNPAYTNLGVEPDQQKLYDLIRKRTLACQMAPAVFDRTTLNLTPDRGHHEFRATGQVLKFAGFLQVYQEGTDDAAEEVEGLLPTVTPGQVAQLRDLLPEQHFTEPPPRYSEASLVKTLEELGIGRPSTYASIISVLVDRGYVRLEQRRFFPEDVGRIVTKFLTEHFEQYVDYHFTANLEADLDAIARGEKQWKPLLQAFWAPFKQRTEEKIETVKKSDVTSESTGEVCPTCQQGELVIRLGRYGRFKACNRYPECKHAEPLVKDTAGEQTAGQSPTPPKGTGVECPECREGEILEKTSRRGKVFFSCNRYPACKYALWDRPETVPCPQCAWPILTVKTTKRYGDVRKCPSCAWQDKETVQRKPAAEDAGTPKKIAPKKVASKKAAPKKAAPKKAAPKKAPATQ